MKVDTMHLFITKRCTNNCPLCCNNNYDIEKVPLPSEEELSSVSTVCLTGGDPFLLGEKLDKIVNALRSRENIKNIYIFTSGYACYLYLNKYKVLPNIDGITFSPKSEKDWSAISNLMETYDHTTNRILGYEDVISNLSSNRIYAFIEKYDDCNYTINNDYLDILSQTHEYLGCKVFFRTWVEDFDSPENEIFRRLENYD